MTKAEAAAVKAMITVTPYYDAGVLGDSAFNKITTRAMDLILTTLDEMVEDDDDQN